jgi:hypothetical protein
MAEEFARVGLEPMFNIEDYREKSAAPPMRKAA